MANMLDYLRKYGSLTFQQMEINPVDALIFSTCAYLHFDGLISEREPEAPSIRELSQMFLELSEEGQEARMRGEKDRELLRLLGESRRFGSLKVTEAAAESDEQEEIQFAAVTFLLEPDGAFVAFRGTDSTLVGWKEDFNLSFLDAIPAQWAARDYLEKIAEKYQGDLYVGGHSKGGNLAVFAAAKANPGTQKRIRAVYNYDGPGFSTAVLADPGYQRVLGRVHTFVPQSSVIGMLLEHEGPYTVVQSAELGLMQHEPYSWEVKGTDFVHLKEVTEGSRAVDETIRLWLASLSRKEREDFVEALFEILQEGGVRHVSDLSQPKHLYAVLKRLGQEDEKTRLMMADVLVQLMRAAAQTFF